MQKAGQISIDEMRKQRGEERKGGMEKESVSNKRRGIWVAWLGDALMLMLLLHILRFRTSQTASTYRVPMRQKKCEISDELYTAVGERELAYIND